MYPAVLTPTQCNTDKHRPSYKNILTWLFPSVEEVLVKCSQTGRKIKSKVEDISRKDMSPLTSSDLKKGSSLMVEMNGKSYPVEFIEFAGIYVART